MVALLDNIVLHMYCYYKCSVALPNCAVCWFAAFPDHTHLLIYFLFSLCGVYFFYSKKMRVCLRSGYKVRVRRGQSMGDIANI